MKASSLKIGIFAAGLAFFAGTILSAEAGRRNRNAPTTPPPTVVIDPTVPVVSID